jgi:RepB DNA-primase from phage plasmid
MHPATLRAATSFFSALKTSIDIGVVAPPRDGESKGRALWFCKAIQSEPGLRNVLGRAAAANAGGEAVYVRVHMSEQEPCAFHPGLVLVDDLSEASVARMTSDGFEPSALVETSPKNFQAWIRLAAADKISRREALEAARLLARRFGGDVRAVSPVQPGRLPGFCNRKPQYRQCDGQFPFVRLRQIRPGYVASQSLGILAEIRQMTSILGQRPTQPGAGRGAPPPETPPMAAKADLWSRIDTIRKVERQRIQDEVANGRRPQASASPSEFDFAAVVGALRRGIDGDDIAAWLSARRPDHHVSYGPRTLISAIAYLGADHTPLAANVTWSLR